MESVEPIEYLIHSSSSEESSYSDEESLTDNSNFISQLSDILGMFGLIYLQRKDYYQSKLINLYNIKYTHIGIYYLISDQYHFQMVPIFTPFDIWTSITIQSVFSQTENKMIMVSPTQNPSSQILQVIQDRYSKKNGNISFRSFSSLIDDLHQYSSIPLFQSPEIIFSQPEEDISDPYLDRNKYLYLHNISQTLDQISQGNLDSDNFLSNIFSDETNSDLILSRLEEKFFQFEKWIESLLSRNSVLDMDQYDHLIQEIHDLMRVDRFVMVKSPKNIDSSNRQNKVIYINSDSEIRDSMFKFRRLLKQTQKSIQENRTPEIDLDQLVLIYNKLNSDLGFDEKELTPIHPSVTIGLIFPGKRNHFERKIQTQSKKIIKLPSVFPYLDKMNFHELEEILISLEMDGRNDIYFDQLKDRIARILAKK